MNIFQFFSYVNSFCCHHRDIIGGQREKNLCANECQAGFRKLAHSPQSNTNSHSQQDRKFGSFYTDISDTIDKAASTGIAKALSHGKDNTTRNWDFFSDMKKPFHFPGGVAESC